MTIWQILVWVSLILCVTNVLGVTAIHWGWVGAMFFSPMLLVIIVFALVYTIAVLRGE